MKHVVVICLLALLPVAAYAIRPVNGYTPVLHSIFDADSPQHASPGIGSGEDGWSKRFSAGPARMPDYIRNARPSSGDYRRTGTGLMIAGGCTAFAGGGLLLYAEAEAARQRANGGRSYVLVPYLFGFLLLLVGAVLALVGFPVWLTHLK